MGPLFFLLANLNDFVRLNCTLSKLLLPRGIILELLARGIIRWFPLALVLKFKPIWFPSLFRWFGHRCSRRCCTVPTRRKLRHSLKFTGNILVQCSLLVFTKQPTNSAILDDDDRASDIPPTTYITCQSTSRHEFVRVMQFVYKIGSLFSAS